MNSFSLNLKNQRHPYNIFCIQRLLFFCYNLKIFCSPLKARPLSTHLGHKCGVMIYQRKVLVIILIFKCDF